MTNIASSKRRIHSLNGSDAGGLGHISQVHSSAKRTIKKILNALVEKKHILPFEKPTEELASGSLKYTIFFNKKRFYYVIFSRAKNISILFGGAEVSESSGWKLSILLNKDCMLEPKRIKNILIEDLKERKNGLMLERVFYKDFLALIACDKEVSQIIKSIRFSEDYDDTVNKIDFFIILKNGKEVPLQIKSSISGQTKHKKTCFNVPSLIYWKKFSQSLLKDKLLLICRSYPNYIEHL